jgi:hypothetical protein
MHTTISFEIAYHLLLTLSILDQQGRFYKTRQLLIAILFIASGPDYLDESQRERNCGKYE